MVPRRRRIGRDDEVELLKQSPFALRRSPRIALHRSADLMLFHPGADWKADRVESPSRRIDPQWEAQEFHVARHEQLGEDCEGLRVREKPRDYAIGEQVLLTNQHFVVE